MALRFGTDGVRGVANVALTPELALAIGRAAAQVLACGTFVVGRDTRRSGAMLSQAFCAGLAAEGVVAVDLGVVPTPCVAYVASERGCAGAVISASHNPFPDNGIKILGAGGLKLADEVERRIEAALDVLDLPVRTGAAVGTIEADDGSGVAAYVEHLCAALEGRDLAGLRVVVDAANGAASRLAAALFTTVGVSVQSIHASPDGVNINEGCGATHLAALSAAVIEDEADFGLALDGDADRLLAVDGRGETVDGDQIMAILARDLVERGQLRHGTVVVTVMTNLGFRLGMADAGIRVVDTAVGDRYVLEALDAGGYSMGGEQSGHVILRDLASTGDGMLTGLLLADVVKRSGRTLGELAAEVMQRLPQVLINVRLERNDPTLTARLAADIAAVEAELGDHGRVLVRPSGTEPLLRVMVEAPTAELAQGAAERLAARVRKLAH